ncbi:ZrgA family zinc uptake protein [Reinekea marinisedimentorum]|uniref:Uncharacterized protein DUF2796 n=1 Tax=Reinekea marinisedimentorum TaxID=230495 RepID=A0A4R3I9R1_9GAMM|nr:DUF2796 domain-containing protein [Reinekea marinisedimentorum]TCS41045.1 uncharacterized protein DUF2796 [Reinekea marinisedimentorum]
MKKLSLTAAIALTLCTAAQAETERQHGAHEHGAAKLLIAQEGEHVEVILETPAYNVIGFEHMPSTDEQLEVAHHARHELSEEGLKLVQLSKSAKCELEAVEIESEIMDYVRAHFHDEEHGHEHEEHGDHEAHADHEDHDDHDHDHEGSVHSEIHVHWAFHCDNVAKLKDVDVKLFEAFPNFADIDVEYLVGDSSGMAEANPKQTKVKF